MFPYFYVKTTRLHNIFVMRIVIKCLIVLANVCAIMCKMGLPII